MDTEPYNSEQILARIKADLTKPVLLVGMMGTGKTSIGRKLAQCLGYDFFDSDHEIEEKAGMSVADVFENFGEEKFRLAEKNTVLELLKKRRAVIATGGGAVTHEETRKAIQDQAVSIWLKADPQALYERIKDKRSRPLLAQDDPLAVLTRLSEQRHDFYAQADIHMDLSEYDSSRALETVVQGLFGYLKDAKV
jgi:shikimate kinase